MDFVGNPNFLWITLLIFLLNPEQSPKNQGLHHIASKKSKSESLYKSMTYGAGSLFCLSAQPAIFLMTNFQFLCITTKIKVIILGSS
jgi:hypothetical protein